MEPLPKSERYGAKGFMASNGVITALPAPRTKRAPRSFTGAALDVRSCGTFMGTTDRVIRSLVAKGIIPYRRLGNRIVFLRSEIENWLTNLPGCSMEEARRNFRAREEDR
jgi:hypothetical protein